MRKARTAMAARMRQSTKNIFFAGTTKFPVLARTGDVPDDAASCCRRRLETGSPQSICRLRIIWLELVCKVFLLDVQPSDILSV